MLDKFLKEILIIDTETTGVNTAKEDVVELAVCKVDGAEPVVNSRLFGSREPIPYASSAVNNISRRMLSGLPILSDSIPTATQMLDVDNVKYYVGHNVSFDTKILSANFKRGGVTIEKLENKDCWICTHRIAKYIINDDSLKYGQQFLRYYFDLDSYVTTEITAAHRAGNDAVICYYLLMSLIDLGVEKGNINLLEDIGKQLVQLSQIKRPVTSWPFGKKYKGKKFSELPDDFYKWAFDNIDELDEKHPKYREDIVEIIRVELSKRFEEREKKENESGNISDISN